MYPFGSKFSSNYDDANMALGAEQDMGVWVIQSGFSLYIRLQPVPAEELMQRPPPPEPELPCLVRFKLYANGVESEELQCVWQKWNKDKGKHELGELSLPVTQGKVPPSFELPVNRCGIRFFGVHPGQGEPNE